MIIIGVSKIYCYGKPVEVRVRFFVTEGFKKTAEELLLRLNNLILQRENLKEMYSRIISLEPSEISLISTDERLLQKILSIMEENMSNSDFDVDFFSRAAGMSRAQLNRKLKALTDLSPNEFIRTMRMKRAVKLIQHDQGNIGEVAFLVGFSSTNYFTKCFKDFYGITPSEYYPSGPATKERLS